MAHLNLLKSFITGSMGETTGAILKTQPILKTRIRTNKSKTEAQQAHRAGYKKLLELWNNGYSVLYSKFDCPKKTSMSSLNYFLSLNGAYMDAPDKNYSNLVLMAGDVPSAVDIKIGIIQSKNLKKASKEQKEIFASVLSESPDYLGFTFTGRFETYSRKYSETDKVFFSAFELNTQDMSVFETDRASIIKGISIPLSFWAGDTVLWSVIYLSKQFPEGGYNCGVIKPELLKKAKGISAKIKALTAS